MTNEQVENTLNNLCDLGVLRTSPELNAKIMCPDKNDDETYYIGNRELIASLDNLLLLCERVGKEL